MKLSKKLISAMLLGICISNFSIVDAKSSTDKMPSSVEKYESQKQKLLEKNRFAADYQLSEDELKVDRKLARFKSMSDVNYRPDLPFYEFVNVDENLIESDPLYQFLKSMPKGSNLHTHSSALLSIEKFYDLCSRIPNLRIDMDGKIPGKLSTSEGIPFNEADRTKVLKAWTIGIEDSDKRAWDVFEDQFRAIGDVFWIDPQIYREYYYLGFLEQAQDNLNRLEIRCSTPDWESGDRGKLAAQLLLDAYRGVQKDYPDFSVKIIVPGHKERSTVEKSQQQFREVIEKEQYLQREVKDESNDFFIGVDLVTEEDAGYPLDTYVPILIEAKNKGFDFDVYLHAGESNSPDNSMMLDAYLMGTKRIGHGIDLFRYPELAEKIRKHKIALEVCPISNQLLGYTSDLRNHPAYLYFKEGIPIAIASDDPAMFNVKGVSYDFYSVVRAWDLNLAEIKQLCLNSIRYSGGSKSERKKLESDWRIRWDKFIKSQIHESDSK